MINAELQALGKFDWMVGGDTGDVVTDTLAAYAKELADQRAEILEALPRVVRPEDVEFTVREDGTVVAAARLVVSEAGFSRLEER